MDTLSLSSVLKTDEYINDHCLLGMQINFLSLFSPLSTLLLAPNAISQGSRTAVETSKGDDRGGRVLGMHAGGKF